MSIRAWAVRQWREWTSRNSILVLLVPSAERGAFDAVAALIPLLKQRLRGFPVLVVLDRALHHLQDVLKPYGSQFAPRRVALFAHPADAHDGFAVNPANDVDITVLRAEWWMGGSLSNIDLLVAHVCDGAAVLRQPSWSHVVAGWISFDGGIDAYLASEEGRQCWASVAAGVVDSVVDGADIASVTMRINRAYLDQMISLHDRENYAAGDTINLCNLERALQQLVCSEE